MQTVANELKNELRKYLYFTLVNQQLCCLKILKTKQQKTNIKNPNILVPQITYLLNSYFSTYIFPIKWNWIVSILYFYSRQTVTYMRTTVNTMSIYAYMMWFKHFIISDFNDLLIMNALQHSLKYSTPLWFCQYSLGELLWSK
jgi:hypothetical protein